jgi:hypothetical protein
MCIAALSAIRVPYGKRANSFLIVRILTALSYVRRHRDTQVMNTRIAVLLGLVLMVLSLGCARASEPPRDTKPPTTPGDTLPKADRALVVTADVTLRVGKIDDVTNRIRASVDAEGGYIANASTHGEGDDAYGMMDLRVPVARASAFRAMLRTLDEVASEDERVEDVTEQHADLSARLKNARNEEARMVDLMAHKSGDISEVIAAEKEVARVRETIERLEAEERTMTGQIALATIHATLQPVTTPADNTPGRSIVHAWTSGVHAAKALAVWLSMGVAAATPTLFPIAAFVLAVIAVARRRKARSLA